MKTSNRRSFMLAVTIGLLFVISGCSIPLHGGHHHGKPTPTPKPTATPVAERPIPTKQGTALTVSGKPLCSIGWLDLMENPAFTEPVMREHLRNIKRISNGSVNAVRFFCMVVFRQNALSPWLPAGNKWDLSQINPAWLQRLDLVLRVLTEEGFCPIPSVVDCWSVRDKGHYPGWFPGNWLNPAYQIDTRQPRQFQQADFDTPNAYCLTRNLYWAPVPGHNPCSGVQAWGHSPVMDELFRAVARTAKPYPCIIQLANEMFSDPQPDESGWPQSDYDVPMIAAWIDRMVGIIHSEYPGVLTSFSTINTGGRRTVEGGAQCEIYAADIYRHVDVADIHAFQAGPSDQKNNVAGIPAAVRFIRQRAPQAAVMVNTDGCVELETQRKSGPWIVELKCVVTGAGAYPEALIDFPTEVGVFEGLR